MAGGAFVKVDLNGVDRYLASLAAAAKETGSMRLVAGSPLGYSFGVETGKTKGGRTARAAGGAWMLRDGLAETQQQIEPLIVQSLERGTGAGKDATDAIRRTLLGNIQRRTPVRSGRLRDSFVVKGMR